MRGSYDDSDGGDHTSCPGDVRASTLGREVASGTPPAIHGAIPPQPYKR